MIIYLINVWINGFMDIYYLYVIFFFKYRILLVFCLIFVVLKIKLVCMYKN